MDGESLAERHHESCQCPVVHAGREVSFCRRARQPFCDGGFVGGAAGGQDLGDAGVLWRAGQASLDGEAAQGVVVDGDRVAARLVDTGTPVKEGNGLAPTGASVSFAETAFYRVEDGRFKSMWYLMDADTVRRQLAGRPAD